MNPPAGFRMADQDMPGFKGMRYSKFRHVYGNPFRRERCYNNIPITKNSHDAFFCAVNPLYVAVVLESQGGGAFIVIPVDKFGRQDSLNNKISGHKGPVLDIKWNPFNDMQIASSSDDGTVKVWEMPDEETPLVTENNTSLVADLVRHSRRVVQVEWHPTAEGILLSVSQDNRIIIWDVEQQEVFKIIECHPDRVQYASWNWVGDLIATTCKDKKIRVIDARQGEVLKIGDGHTGTKNSKITFAGDTDYLITTGTSRSSNRQIAVWNQNDLSTSIEMLDIDYGTGIQLLFYDPDSRVAFVAGKGDGSIRYFEINPDESPCIFRLNEFITSMPQCGLGIMPKRGVDRKQCELIRFYKLHVSKGICEPVSMIVPRKSEAFQEDIYPPTAANEASLSAQSWMAGQDAAPKMVLLGEHQSSRVESMPLRISLRASSGSHGNAREKPATTASRAAVAERKGSPSRSVAAASRTSSTRHFEVLSSTSSSPPAGRGGVQVRPRAEIVQAEIVQAESAAPPTQAAPAAAEDEVFAAELSPPPSQAAPADGRSIASRMAMFEDGSRRGWRRAASVDSAMPPPVAAVAPAKITLQREAIHEESGGSGSGGLGKERGDRSPLCGKGAAGIGRRTFGVDGGKEVLLLEAEPLPEKGRGSGGGAGETEAMVRSNGDGSEAIARNARSADAGTRREFMTSKDLGMEQLRKAFLRQQEEIKQLKSQLMLKDQRIRQLEREIEELSSEA